MAPASREGKITVADAIALVDGLRKDFEIHKADVKDDLETVDELFEKQAEINEKTVEAFHSFDMQLLEVKSSMVQKIDAVDHKADRILERLPEKKPEPSILDWIQALQWPVVFVVGLGVYWILTQAGKPVAAASAAVGISP